MHPTRRGAHCAPVALWGIAWWNIRQTLYNFYVRQNELPSYARPMKGFRPAFFKKAGWSAPEFFPGGDIESNAGQDFHGDGLAFAEAALFAEPFSFQVLGPYPQI